MIAIFDRYSYETAHRGDSPDTRLYGLPDHVPIDREIMSQYARCAIDSGAVNQKAVCWSKKSRENPAMPASADPFNTNGYTNCQADGIAMVCDPPKQPAVLPAPWLADPQLICENKRHTVTLSTGIRIRSCFHKLWCGAAA